MFDELLFPVIALLMLGIFHGINPGMGWLFAVGLGLQEQRRAAVWSALLPLALGHALAIGITLLVAGVIGLIIPAEILKWIVAGVLIMFGLSKLHRNRHPRYGGMEVHFGQLTIWSFLMASAHGAGLMVLPFLFSSIDSEPLHAGHVVKHVVQDTEQVITHAGHADILTNLPTEPLIGLIVILVHTVGYLLIMGIVAVIVYEKVGLRLLKSGWYNIDMIWAFALILSGSLIPLL